LALLYAGLFSVSILVLFVLTYGTASVYAMRDEGEEIGVEFKAIQDEARLAGESRLPQIIEDHLRERLGEHAVYLLQDAQGRKLAGNIAPRTPVLGRQSITASLDGQVRRLHGRGYFLMNGDYLLIGEDPPFLRDMNRLIAWAFGINASATLVLAVLGGAVISRRALSRVEAVGRTTQAIIGGDLSQRIASKGTEDEFDRLAGSVNAMLDRIEDLMKNVRQVSSDIAHDLRTPLTRLRQRLEHASRHADSVEELRTTLATAIDQVDSILETFGALLRIAQIEASTASSAGVTPVDLSELLLTVVDDFAPAAADRGQVVSADVAPGLVVPGDRDQLVQLAVNLLDNAIRHCPAGAQITVSARESAAGIEAAVADTGPGIPEYEREKVLRPFYRLEASRTTPGSGLGLSLVVAIAKRHRAALSLGDNAPGLRVSVNFPKAA
jgi:signal transduction histidine kinase